MSWLFLFASLTIHKAVHGASFLSSFFSPTHGSMMMDLDLKSGEIAGARYSLWDLFELEAKEKGYSILFAEKVTLNGADTSYGPMYYTSKPIIESHFGSDYFYVDCLRFHNENEFSTLSPADREGTEDMKRKLITRKIFNGRKEHILVNNIIVNNVSYGPILLPAEFY